MAHLDYYATLEVSPESTDEEIKKSYRRLVFQYHPDRNDNSSEAQAKIREINAAYEILGDPSARLAYERLRFGGHGTPASGYADEPDQGINPAVILEEMERTLWNEGRKEIFGVLIQNIPKIKEELARIRTLTLETQGYDAFNEEILKKQASATIPTLLTVEMETRKENLLHVAFHMMLTKGVTRVNNDRDQEATRQQLARAFEHGRVDGYCEACELLYTRR